MRDPASELPRISLPRTPVNRARRKGEPVGLAPSARYPRGAVAEPMIPVKVTKKAMRRPAVSEGCRARDAPGLASVAGPP
jgi:hypothetical protein